MVMRDEGRLEAVFFLEALCLVACIGSRS